MTEETQKTTVYAVYADFPWDRNGRDLHRLFTTEEKAKAFIEKSAHPVDYDIEEWELE